MGNIPKKDFDKIHQLACDVVNAFGRKSPESEISALNAQLIAQLDIALAKYGEQADLLAIKADFLDNPDEAIPLLQKALALALSEGDQLNVLLVGDSLLRAMVERGDSIGETELVYDKCRKFAEENLLLHQDDYKALEEFYEGLKG